MPEQGNVTTPGSHPMQPSIKNATGVSKTSRVRNVINGLCTALRVCNHYILTLCRGSVIITTMSIFAIVILGVFFRYVLNNALVWADEIAKFCMVWMCFLGAPIVLERGGHVAIELLSDRLKGPLNTALHIVCQSIILCTLAILVRFGTDLAIRAIPQHSTAVPWLSLFFVYVSIPVGAVLMLPISLEIFLKKFVTHSANEKR